MTTQTEALKLALEALETSARNWPSDSIIEAITAIKEVLAQPEQERCVGCEACIDTACGRDECPKGWPKAAQPEQEPVACVVPHGATMRLEWASVDAAHNAKIGPLYTTPPQRAWVGLTDEDIEHIIVSVPFAGEEDYEVVIRAAITKFKEKNT